MARRPQGRPKPLRFAQRGDKRRAIARRRKGLKIKQWHLLRRMDDLVVEARQLGVPIHLLPGHARVAEQLAEVAECLKS